MPLIHIAQPSSWSTTPAVFNSANDNGCPHPQQATAFASLFNR
ncbi:hypothetical protein [Paraflavitalea pollutisoli]|nr:hypothetical protein [Paraflavitalea sp. H1-2-19X]